MKLSMGVAFYMDMFEIRRVFVGCFNSVLPGSD
jgi:hypothetical protein